MKLTLDPISDSNGYSTIRLADGTPHGDTEAQPIATVYNNDYAAILAAAPELAEVLHRFVISIEAGNIVRPDFAIFQHARHALQKAGLVS